MFLLTQISAIIEFSNFHLSKCSHAPEPRGGAIYLIVLDWKKCICFTNYINWKK